MRSASTALITACALAAAVGTANSARAETVVPNSFVYMYNLANYGVGVGNVPGALNKPGDAGPTTWTWSTSVSDSQPMIDNNGRIYFRGRFTASPVVGTIAAANHFGFFSATNNADVGLIQQWATGQIDPNTSLPIVNNANSSSGIGSSNFYRVSGNRFGLTVAVGNPPSGTGINQSTSGTGATALLQNNQLIYTGPFNSPAFASRLGDAVTTLPSSNDWTAASPLTGQGNLATTWQSASTQSVAMNSSGVIAFGGALTTVGPNPATAPVTATASVAATTGNAQFLGTVAPGGQINVIARAGDLPFGAGGPQFNSSSNGGGGTNGVGGFNVKIAQNGSVAYDAKFLDRGTGTSSTGYTPGPGGVVPSTANSAWIYTPGAGSPASRNTQIYQSGVNIPVTATSNGSASWSGSINNLHLSNAGAVWTGTTTGGDSFASPSGTNADQVATNTSVLAVSTVAGGLTPTYMLRQNDPAPGFAPASNVKMGIVGGGNNLQINNSGKVAFAATLQGPGVTPSIAPVYTTYFPPPFGLPTPGAPTITPGQFGNEAAIFVGSPNITGPAGLHAIARKGDLAPGMGGATYDISPSSAVISGFNNNGDVLFTTPVGNKHAGDVIDAFGPAGGVVEFNALFGYSAALDSITPMIYVGQQVEVTPGVFKYVLQFAVNNQDNGNGAGVAFNDSGKFVAEVGLADSVFATSPTSYAYISMQIPAPASGVLGLCGLGVLARRRRRN